MRRSLSGIGTKGSGNPREAWHKAVDHAEKPPSPALPIFLWPLWEVAYYLV